jgi:hypothetical protein
LALIQRISFTTRDRSGVGVVVDDIETSMTDFESGLFKFSGRKSNEVEDKLARSVEPSLNCNLWVGVIPELIRDGLCNDVSLSMKCYILAPKKQALQINPFFKIVIIRNQGTCKNKNKGRGTTGVTFHSRTGFVGGLSRKSRVKFTP